MDEDPEEGSCEPLGRNKLTGARDDLLKSGVTGRTAIAIMRALDKGATGHVFQNFQQELANSVAHGACRNHTIEELGAAK